MLLIFLVTFIVILAFQPLFKKYFPHPPAPTQRQNQPAQSQPAPSAASAMAPPVRVPVGGTRQASGETETVIESDLYHITFTNKGAQVKSWILKKFDNEAQNGPLDLVNPTAAAQYGYPLSLWTYDDTLRNRLSSALYVASPIGHVKAEPPSGNVELKSGLAPGQTLDAPATITF